jgi:hypothetical protein
VHATGRYFQNSMVEILKHDFGLHVYSAPRPRPVVFPVWPR